MVGNEYIVSICRSETGPEGEERKAEGDVSDVNWAGCVIIRVVCRGSGMSSGTFLLGLSVHVAMFS